MQRFFRLLAAAVTAALAGCAYHFTNDHIVRPEGIQTLAVEAVYDTSREVVPHELLWEALQQAVAMDGHLRLAPQSSADALLRAHLRTAIVSSTGTEVLNGPRRDPDPTKTDTPPLPEDFSVMTQAGAYRDTAALTMVVDVEVWSLRTRALLLKQRYDAREAFRAVHQTKAQEFTTAGNDYLRFEEAEAARFRNASLGIGRAVVRDLLVH